MAAALVPTFDATLSRVILTISGLNATTASTTVVRWDGSEPQTAPNAFSIRGANIGAAVAGVVYDYEFADGFLETYQIKSFNASGTLLDTVTATITPSNSGLAWVKDVFRPYLNQTVLVTDYSPISYQGRGDVFNVLGASAPVAITDVLSLRQFTLSLVAANNTEDRALGLLFSPGDIIQWQPPGTAQGALLPAGGYFYVSGISDSRRSTYGVHRYWDVSLIEVARPDPTVVGYSATWAGVVSTFSAWGTGAGTVTATFATWSALLAFNNPINIVIS